MVGGVGKLVGNCFFFFLNLFYSFFFLIFHKIPNTKSLCQTISCTCWSPCGGLQVFFFLLTTAEFSCQKTCTRVTKANPEEYASE